MNFSTTMDVGDLITIGVFLFTLYALHTKNIERFAKMETKVNLMWESLKARLNIREEDNY
jgi:hypothetical protein